MNKDSEKKWIFECAVDITMMNFIQNKKFVEIISTV